MLSSPTTLGIPPPPHAVLAVARDTDHLGDRSPNNGSIYVGDVDLPAAQHTIAWLRSHGYAVRIHFCASQAVALARFPNLVLDVGDDLRDEGRRLLDASRRAEPVLTRAAFPSIGSADMTIAAAAEAVDRPQLAAMVAAPAAAVPVPRGDGGGGALVGGAAPSGVEVGVADVIGDAISEALASRKLEG